MSTPEPPQSPERPPTGAVSPQQPSPAFVATPDHPWSYSVTLLIVGVIFLIFLVPYVAQQIAFAIARDQEHARAKVAAKELEGLPAEGSRYALVAKIVEPSVVAIEATNHVASPFGGNRSFASEVQTTTQGSGVIVNSSRYILTNAHAISQAAQGKVTVQRSDGRTVMDTTIVGVDPAADLAVSKIDAGNLNAAKWGNSDALEVGDLVLVVGSPYGLTETVTVAERPNQVTQ